MTKQEQEQQAHFRIMAAKQKAQIESMKRESELIEVKAKYWVGQVSIMKSSLEYETLLPEYEAHQMRMKAKEDALEAQRLEAMKKLQDTLAEVEAEPEQTETEA